ncbi:CheY-like chemotaxis protein [Catalinimonas alkaloidigena]|uniref:response regulator n=1 Tax=Catalinimonas alkaloidigena TaxID=1075417 RepID=UPI0024067A43|nr:response regulator [Catalinimonas alkaloidigena]MDF9795800.1 CheY-like chemotaxis protein [Catalinimonas alkaloidigena]
MEKIKQVFVIDDDPINNIIFQKLSEFVDFAEEIIPFLSAVDSLDYLQKLEEEQAPPPNIIFLDIRMPIVNGWEFLERLSKLNKNHYFEGTAIYMLTSSSEQSDINKAKNYHLVTDYIVKPLLTEDLEAIKEKMQAETA